MCGKWLVESTSELLLQILYGQNNLLPMQHGVAVRAHRSHVLLRVQHVLLADRVHGLEVVDVDEALAQRTVCRTEVESAHHAGRTPSLNAARLGRGISLIPSLILL